MKLYKFHFFKQPVGPVYVRSIEVMMASGNAFPRTTRWNTLARDVYKIEDDTSAVSVRHKNKTWLRVDLASKILGYNPYVQKTYAPLRSWHELRARPSADSRPAGGARPPFTPPFVEPPKLAVPPVQPGIPMETFPAEESKLEGLLQGAVLRLAALRRAQASAWAQERAAFEIKIMNLETELTAAKAKSHPGLDDARVRTIEFLKKENSDQGLLLDSYREHASNWLQLTASEGTWSMQAIAAALAIPGVSYKTLFRYLRDAGEFAENADGEESCLPKALDFKRAPTQRRWHYVPNVQITGGSRMVAALRVRGPGLLRILQVVRLRGHVIPSDKLVGITESVAAAQKELELGLPKMPG